MIQQKICVHRIELKKLTLVTKMASELALLLGEGLFLVAFPTHLNRLNISFSVAHRKLFPYTETLEKLVVGNRTLQMTSRLQFHVD